MTTISNVQVEQPQKRRFQSVRESNAFVILVVAAALFLDNMLLTIIVPIMPEYLYNLQFRKDNLPGTNSTNDGYVDQNISQTERHHFLIEKSSDVGLMIGSKAVVQLLANPIVGPATNKFGYSAPMFFGYIIMFISTIIFAFGISYPVLFLARALQGVGSACASVSGLGLLASRYTDDNERGKAMSWAMSGLAFGVVVGPPVGGVLYKFWGKTIPFLSMCALILFGVSLQLSMINKKVSSKRGDEKPPSLRTLLMDPYILIAAGGLCMANIGFAFLDASLSIWMMDTMNSESWELGVVFIPSNVCYWIGLALFSNLQKKMGRWMMSIVGMIFSAISLMAMPLSRNIFHVSFPIGVLGLANAMAECALIPELGHLVDIRHSPIYGNVYAIGDVALCLGFAIGPVISGFIMKEFGFTGMMLGCGAICLLYAPLFTILKNPPRRRLSPDSQSTANIDEKLMQVELMSQEPEKLVLYDNNSTGDL